METSILKVQIDQVKVKLITDIDKKIIQIGQPEVFFNQQLYYVDPFNPNIIISIYGFTGNRLSYDSLKIIGKEINLQTLPVELLMLISQELEYIIVSNYMNIKEN